MASRRCAEWRFPTEKQQRKEDMERKLRRDPDQAPKTDEACWWDAVLSDSHAETPRPSPSRTLGEIRSDLLRVECLRCFRIVEIQRLDAIKLYGSEAAWKDVGSRLLNNGCEQRTGRHEEDGCWPDFRG
jgi:hypothetical protein